MGLSQFWSAKREANACLPHSLKTAIISWCMVSNRTATSCWIIWTSTFNRCLGSTAMNCCMVLRTYCQLVHRWSPALLSTASWFPPLLVYRKSSPKERQCLRYTKFWWVGKHVNIIMKPTNSPTQGQPNPKKNRLKVAFGPFFPTAKYFFLWVGIDLCRKQTARNSTQPNYPKKTPC